MAERTAVRGAGGLRLRGSPARGSSLDRRTTSTASPWAARRAAPSVHVRDAGCTVAKRSIHKRRNRAVCRSPHTHTSRSKSD